MVVCICVFFFFFLSLFLSQAVKLKSRCPTRGSSGRFCHLTVVLANFWTVFSLIFGARSTQPHCFFQDTSSSAAFSSSFAPAAWSTGHAGGRSSASGLNAPESLLLFDACDGHAPPFSDRARWGWGLRWLIYGWMVTARVIRAPSYLAESAPAFYAGSFVFWFFCFVLCISLFSHVQSACVLLIFYWNLCWLDVRSALFYLRVSVNVRESQM
jgi:hypothetical protein